MEEKYFKNWTSEHASETGHLLKSKSSMKGEFGKNWSNENSIAKGKNIPFSKH